MDWKETIQNLLNQANDGGVTEAEAEAFRDKAMYLMTKFGVQEAELRSKNKNGEPFITEVMYISAPYAKNKAIILSIIASFLGGMVVTENNRATVKASVIGYKNDIYRIRTLYLSLLAQLNLEMYSYRMVENGTHLRSFKSSFFYGYTLKLTSRMEEIYKRVEKEIGNSLVLYDQRKKLEEEANRQFENLREKDYTMVARSSSAVRAGVMAATRADLGQGKIKK